VSPVTQADGHDLPRLVDEAVPSMAAVGAFGRKREQGNVGRDLEALRQVPAGLVEDNNGMSAGADFARDLGEMQVHGLGVAGRQDQGSAFTPLRADRAEDIGRGSALVMRG